MIKKLNINIFFFFLFYFKKFHFAKIKIKYKIDDEIITNIDILNEKNYLIFLRPNLKKLSDKEIIKNI